MSLRERGVTLLDTVLASAIVVVILGVAYPGLKIANDTMATSNSLDRVERSGDRLLKVLTEEIRSGLVTGTTDSPPSITVVRPRRDVALSEISGDGATPWTVDSKTIRFVQTGTFSEYDRDEDFNRDGDRVDTFAVGRLEVVENGKVRPILRRARVVLGLPQHRGDLDGDGVDDPMFVLENRSLTLNIHLIGLDRQSRRMRSNVQCVLRLRNIQEQ